MKNKSVLQINKNDNVLVALRDLSAGDSIDFNSHSIVLLENIPAKHKFYINDMNVNDVAVMYGVVVGKVNKSIKKGELMTTKNTFHATTPYVMQEIDQEWIKPNIAKFVGRKFKGFHRADGRVGTANYWLFIPTVFCENRNLDVIKSALDKSLGYDHDDKYQTYAQSLVHAYLQNGDLDSINLTDQPHNPLKKVFNNLDGIKFLNHTGGCGGTRKDAQTLSRLLAAYADHPNVAGVTLLSLGCQHLQVADFKADLHQINPTFDKPLLVFEQQKEASEEMLIQKAILETFKQLVIVNQQSRSDATLDKLCIGVKCGGSDGFSGISANPAVGHCSDLVVALGGKILLSEFPELCGAEQQIIDRASQKTTAEKFIRLMTEYDKLAHQAGSGFHMNPSPGNIKDGLITDAIKSTGAVKKAGSSPVVDVLDYTEIATEPGLNLVCTPGNDVEATTGQTASGATIILFTTGLGTPTGNPICPVVKVSSNNFLAERMSDIIDINAGEIISGNQSIEEKGEEILEFCIAVASGLMTPKAVSLRQDDFIPWKRGVSL
ncbi:altronate dehydratase family protein [Pedobacter sp. MC2016-05]|uniref:UxaA family hydrolase n=1 Tax=Pedobacter sp. MC2016-05 TaxID=2994474 RepID=UPI0022469A73|nr:altronate dehydratase family protein [Pedobacter sp. MC2016-05]MCX2475311.1 altronate dehydratase family protein [Pedobacter sp. MC2016-05]